MDWGISGQYVTRLLDQASLFRGYLLPLILGEFASETYYLGGFLPELSQDVQALRIREQPFSGRVLLVVEIPLHFFPKLPRYQVICGEVKHTKRGA